MLDHLIDPDIPTKRQELEYCLAVETSIVYELENKLIALQDELACARLELAEVEEELRRLDPDSDTKGE